MGQLQVVIFKWKCLRCAWEWIPKVEYPPVRCPHCKSPYWNKPRVRNVQKRRLK